MSGSNGVALISTGGTILHQDGSLETGFSPTDLVAGADLGSELQVFELERIRGAEHTLESVILVRDALRRIASEQSLRGGVVLVGTDGMEEFAFALDLLMAPGSFPVAVTGAMRASGLAASDALSNLRSAVVCLDAVSAHSSLGVVVVMNQTIHAARYVRKVDATRLDAFRSIAGPLGELRNGRPRLYFTGLPECKRFPHVDAAAVKGLRVLLWSATLGGDFPTEALDGFDGVVVAGMGTGSIPKTVIEDLSPEWTARIPIVLVSRCETGLAYDDELYAGSKSQRESEGFILSGFEGLTGPQARLKLALMIASTSA